MYKLTVFNPDGSIADVLLIPDNLAIELTNVLENSKRKSLDLALLREIKVRALSVVSTALKEASETRYWIQLMIENNLAPEAKFSSMLDELNRIIKILIATTKKLKDK